MLKLHDLLNLPEYRPRRRVTKRFWWFVAIVIGYILLAVLVDKLAPDCYFTSNYWRG